MPVAATVAGQGGTANPGQRRRSWLCGGAWESSGRAPDWVQGRLLEGWFVVVVGRSFGWGKDSHAVCREKVVDEIDLPCWLGQQQGSAEVR